MGLLEQGGIKLSAVVSDLFGVSGWAMLERIGQGVTDVEVLAGQARGVLRKKDAELKQALSGAVAAAAPAEVAGRSETCPTGLRDIDRLGWGRSPTCHFRAWTTSASGRQQRCKST